MTTTVQQLNVEDLLKNPDIIETIPMPEGEETVRILWMSEIPARQRQDVMTVFGPTLRDVEKNLDVLLYYDSRMPQVVPTEDLLEHVERPEVREEIAKILAEEGTSKEKYFRSYFAMFGPRRVTFTQLDEVTQHLRKKFAIAVPHKMSWYFRFEGYNNFIGAFLEWLTARGKGRDLPEGEDVLLREPPIPLDHEDFEY